MSATRIRVSNDSETWRVNEDTRTRYVRIRFDEDADSVVVDHAYHKDPWICDGVPFDSFAEARRSNGLPAVDDTPTQTEAPK